MTVSTTNNRINQLADGIEVTFIYDYIINNTDEMKVYLDNVLQALGYTVNGVGNPSGGDVVFAVAPASGVVVTLQRIVDETQLVDYQPYDPFPAETHEGALDKLTLITQQNSDAIDRAVLAPVDDDGTTDYTLPVYEAGKGIVWDETLKKFVNSNDIVNNITTDAQQSADDSAVSAAESAASAVASASSAQDSLDTFNNFETKYLGEHAVDPVLDNQGGALIDGAMYFNTTNDIVKVYDLGTTTWRQIIPTASEQANIDAVAGDEVDIGIAADNIGSINLVASNINSGFLTGINDWGAVIDSVSGTNDYGSIS